MNDETPLLSNPLKQFAAWYQEAQQQGEPNLDAMTLATADRDGHPSARIVLYKGMSKGGFLIYTNYDSRKAQDLEETPHAALAFYWPGLYRQIRVEGDVAQITREESQQYFATRSRESRVSAWISPQSQEIPDRQYLLDRIAEQTADPENCPAFWGGYRLIPNKMEFWIGRDHRLHDRFCYTRQGDQWVITQLAP